MGSCKCPEYEDIKKVEYLFINDKDYADEIEVNLGDDYEYKFEMNRLYILKKKPKYPKTYKECCEMVNACHTVGISYNSNEDMLYNDEVDLTLLALRKLIICRNAYWKIAGEEMGLDKPWEPNWTTFEGMPAIFRFRYNIVCDSVKNQHCLLVFPTEEMRDAFYENFKDLIEQCKELL